MPNKSSLPLIKLFIFLGYQFVHDYFGLYFWVINLYMNILVYNMSSIYIVHGVPSPPVYQLISLIQSKCIVNVNKTNS